MKVSNIPGLDEKIINDINLTIHQRLADGTILKQLRIMMYEMKNEVLLPGDKLSFRFNYEVPYEEVAKSYNRRPRWQLLFQAIRRFVNNSSKLLRNTGSNFLSSIRK